MTISEKSNPDYDELLQKVDDLTVEVEIQTNYLATVKWLLITIIVMLIPVVLFVGYIFYRYMNPIFYF